MESLIPLNCRYNAPTRLNCWLNVRTDSKLIISEMMSGDYENLVAVFEREFGDYVTLYL